MEGAASDGSRQPSLCSLLASPNSGARAFRARPVVSLLRPRPSSDFATTGRTKAECQRNLDRAIQIFGLLGLKLNPAKIFSPSQLMEFLGVLIDSVRRVVSLVPEKMALYDQLVGRTLEADEQGSLVV